MRLVTFADNGSSSVGVEESGRVFDLGAAWMATHGSALTMVDAVANQSRVRALYSSSRGEESRWRPGSPRLMAPIQPGKVVAIGLNYVDHATEQQAEPPKEPLIFAKFPSSVIGPGDPIVRPSFVEQLDYEAELGVVIGRRARNVSREEALGYVGGYLCLHDVSARDLQFGDKQWVRGKSLDTFCPIGPAIVTPDEIPDPGRLAIGCVLNGQVMQSASTADLIFSVPELISYLSRMFTLEPGDVIATGTPPGVGVFRNPPVFLKGGDEVTVTVEGVGSLTNPVVDA